MPNLTHLGMLFLHSPHFDEQFGGTFADRNANSISMSISMTFEHSTPCTYTGGY